MLRIINRLPPKTLWLASLRYYLKHPWLLALTLLGLASGVGVVIAIDIAVSSAQRQLDNTVSALAGDATHQIIGGPTGIEQSVFVDLKQKQRLRHISPVINGLVFLNPENPMTFNLLGIDPFNESNFRHFIGASLPDEKSLSRFLTTRHGVLLSASTAKYLGVVEGNQFTIYVGNKKNSLTLIGFLPDDPALQNLIITDIANAQSIFALGTRLTRIDLQMTDTTLLSEIEKLMPADTQLIATQSGNAGLDQLTLAFRTNLQAMSLLALLIGTFVVFTTVRFSIINRMRQFGLYRVAGVTGSELSQLILIEVFCLSLTASVLGLIAGVLLANALIGLVTQTFSDHYFDIATASVHLSLFTLAKAFSIGVIVALLTAYLPGRQAARAKPVTVGIGMELEKDFAKSLNSTAMFGLFFGLAGTVIIGFSSSLTAAFAGLFFYVLGFALLVPAMFSQLNKVISRYHWRHMPLPVLMGLRDVRRSLSRTGVAMIAMVIALSATFGVAIMVSSFRIAVSDWLDTALKADIYISIPDRLANPATQKFDQLQIQQAIALDGVRDFSQGRHLLVNSEHNKHVLMMVDLPLEGFEGFQLLQHSTGNLYQQFNHDDAILVTEPFAYHQGLSSGDSVTLNTSNGMRSFKVIGIYRDYGSESGKITMSRQVYEKYWPAVGVTTLGLYLTATAKTEEIIQSLSLLHGADQHISIYSSKEIRQKSLTIFDRTFLITEVLRILILGVAVVTIIVSLMSWQLERRRELAIAQAIGFLPIQLQLQLFTQSLFMAFNAFLFSIPLGLLISWILVHIINKRSFGWSMELIIEPSQFVYAGLSALIAAAIAASYPAWQITQTSPRAAMQES